MAFLPLYAWIAPMVNVSPEYDGIVPHLWGDGLVYFILLLLPFVCLIRDYAWK